MTGRRRKFDKSTFRKSGDWNWSSARGNHDRNVIGVILKSVARIDGDEKRGDR